MTRSSLRIAILAHSTIPRGGVVHALELADALVGLGCEAVAHAPDANKAGFFRPTLCETVSVPATPVGADVTAMVETRIADYVRYFETPAHRRFDVLHAQDGISGNALATLKERGLIGRFARTVHHIDAFQDQRLADLQTRSIVAADRHFVVSRLWRDTLAESFGLNADIVGSGVDTVRFSPAPDGREEALRARFGLGSGPVYLSVGGVEARKNTVRILEAFAQVRAVHRQAQLVIAGGVSMLDHSAYRAQFAEALSESLPPRSAVICTGVLAHEDMPALYRLADALVFPSVKEGFGLVVIEAMASGTPAVVSRILPFTEHIAEDEAVWCNPTDIASIADAMVVALREPLRARLVALGPKTSRRHEWRATAQAHLPIYQSLRELQYA